jgi:hypothetical protein
VLIEPFVIQPITRRSIAAVASPFCLNTKRTKKIKSAEMLLCRTRPLPANPEKPRAAIFLPGYPFAFRPCMQKFAMPFATSRGLLFFQISAEAYLLTGYPY